MSKGDERCKKMPPTCVGGAAVPPDNDASSVYGSIGSLTRPVTFCTLNHSAGIGAAVPPDNDAMQRVRIHWFPDPPGSVLHANPQGQKCDERITDKF